MLLYGAKKKIATTSWENTITGAKRYSKIGTGQNSKSRIEEMELRMYLNQENALVRYEMTCEIGESAFIMDRTAVDVPV